jgi:hypothetical protein
VNGRRRGTTARASGHDVWTGAATTFGEVSVILEEGQTTLVQITEA